MTKVLIVEDNFIIAEDLSNILEDLGYIVSGIAASYHDAVDKIETSKPDLCLLDITIRGEKDGIHLAEFIQEKYSIPYLFITSHADRITVERAKKTNPKGYIVKPFDQDDVYTSIEIAIAVVDRESGAKPFVLLKNKGNLERVFVENISHTKTDGNYLEIYTLDGKKYLNRQSLKDFLDMEQMASFCQVHKSYAVNLDQMVSFNSRFVNSESYQIPIGKKYATVIKQCMDARNV